VHARLGSLCDAKAFVGRAPEQVDEFLAAEVEPLLASQRAGLAGVSADVRV
jgi:hypothetical protein